MGMALSGTIKRELKRSLPKYASPIDKAIANGNKIMRRLEKREINSIHDAFAVLLALKDSSTALLHKTPSLLHLKQFVMQKINTYLENYSNHIQFDTLLILDREIKAVMPGFTEYQKPALVTKLNTLKKAVENNPQDSRCWKALGAFTKSQCMYNSITLQFHIDEEDGLGFEEVAPSQRFFTRNILEKAAQLDNNNATAQQSPPQSLIHAEMATASTSLKGLIIQVETYPADPSAWRQLFDRLDTFRAQQDTCTVKLFGVTRVIDRITALKMTANLSPNSDFYQSKLAYHYVANSRHASNDQTKESLLNALKHAKKAIALNTKEASHWRLLSEIMRRLVPESWTVNINSKKYTAFDAIKKSLDRAPENILALQTAYNAWPQTDTDPQTIIKLGDYTYNRDQFAIKLHKEIQAHNEKRGKLTQKHCLTASLQSHLSAIKKKTKTTPISFENSHITLFKPLGSAYQIKSMAQGTAHEFEDAVPFISNPPAIFF